MNSVPMSGEASILLGAHLERTGLYETELINEAPLYTSLGHAA